ncbi:MAG: methyltransferase domain-containing protein [Hadesarchaea archaeon]|nr:methyltransferase domain-containing protein [Hadesarchaea archaeon]
MKRLMFLTSGEHPTLPKSEILGAIEAENCDFEVINDLDQVLIVKTNANYQVLSERLGMTHWIGKHYCTAQENELLESIGSSDLIDNLPHGESISVRIKRIKQYSPELNASELAKDIADQILEKINFEVDLSNPDNEIIGVLTENMCVVGLLKKRIERSRFRERRPKNRESVHPGTMQPEYARVLVNLARTPREGNFLDPFCGVGGILIEAGLIGARVIGVDINPEMIEGAEKNLKEAKINEFELRVGDARKTSIREIDAIATDPPYGRQASTEGLSISELYEESMPTICDSLKKESYLCISAPSQLELEEIMPQEDLKIEEKHVQRVHKDLTRNIYVIKKV